MIERNLQKAIKKSLEVFPAIGIIGPRQVGKTTLVKEMFRNDRDVTYIDLELPSDLAKLDDPEFYFGALKSSTIVIDEIQRLPKLFPILRALIDKEKKERKYILLGSASPTLIRSSSESLAGRIKYHELMPFSLSEIIDEKDFSLNSFWLRGGYPLSFLANENEISFSWLNSFKQTFVERDIPQLGINIPAPQIKRFWTMLAHNHGQLWNASAIAKGLGITAPTVRNYLDILSETFLVRQLQPFHSNVKKRLIKSPKIYLRDSGLLHSLLGIRSIDELLAHPVIGFSWEGFVIEEIIKNFGEKFDYYFYRSQAGAEIDLILARGDSPKFIVEIKASLAPKLTRSFSIAHQDFAGIKSFVIYSGNQSYELRKDVTVIALKDFIALNL